MFRTVLGMQRLSALEAGVFKLPTRKSEIAYIENVLNEIEARTPRIQLALQEGKTTPAEVKALIERNRDRIKRLGITLTPEQKDRLELIFKNMLWMPPPKDAPFVPSATVPTIKVAGVPFQYIIAGVGASIGILLGGIAYYVIKKRKKGRD